ncbi:MAG: hypothetical protein AAB686_02980 [Patescibacteria group bacterium]
MPHSGSLARFARNQAAIVARIEQHRVRYPDRVERGERREDKVQKALELLKSRRAINLFSRSERASDTDAWKGVDFSVAMMRNGKLVTVHLQVTGTSWRAIRAHQKKHSDVPVFPVSDKRSVRWVAYKLLRKIEQLADKKNGV